MSTPARRALVTLAACTALALLAHAASAAPARPAAAPAEAKPPAVEYRETAGRLIGAALASDHAALRFSQLCDGIGNRLSGSPALERAVTWAAASMREDGLEHVRIQAVTVPHWVRGPEHAEMVAPDTQRVAMLGLGGSVGTPAGGLTADVVVISSFAGLDSLPTDAVRGRIVLYDVPFTSYRETVRYRGEGANRAAARGAVAALVRSVASASLRSPHTGAMGAYVDSIPHIPSAAISVEDAQRIHRLTLRGEHVRVHLEMNARTLPEARSYNVIGELRGREKPDEIVVLGGHLDSWDVGQGAQDDGGGVIVSLESVYLMKKLGLRPRRTVRCVFWTNEENGTRGARAYADSAKGEVERHVAAVESDGGVERPLGFEVGVLRAGTNESDTTLTARAVQQLAGIAPLLAGIGANLVRAGGGEADIGPLMRRGVPGISVRTTMDHYFDWHHSEADMLDKVDPVELRKNVAAMAVLVYVLADQPQTLPRGAAAAPAAAATH
jgi:carboxypeptidase Q